MPLSIEQTQHLEVAPVTEKSLIAESPRSLETPQIASTSYSRELTNVSMVLDSSQIEHEAFRRPAKPRVISGVLVNLSNDEPIKLW